jgi:hypothetical protein
MGNGSHQSYNQGYRGYFSSADLDENPYDYGTPEFIAWEKGWKEAEDDDSAAADFDGFEEPGLDYLHYERWGGDGDDDD